MYLWQKLLQALHLASKLQSCCGQDVNESSTINVKTIPIKDTSITFKINGNPYSGNYGNIGSGVLSSGIKN